MAQTLFDLIQADKDDFWKTNPQLPEELKEHLWWQIQSLVTKRRTQPRSLSTGAQLESFHHTGLPAHAPVPSLQREFSRQSAPATSPMIRLGTQNSLSGHSSYGSAPAQESTFTLEHGKDDQVSLCPLSSSSGRQFEAVGDYLGRMDPEYPHVPTTPLTSQNKKIRDRRSVCSDQSPSFHYYASHYPSTPTSAELTNGTTVASGMSRQPSTIGSSVCDGMEMIRLLSADSNINVNGENSQVDLRHFDKSSGTSAPISLSFIGAAVGDSAQFPSQSFDQQSLPTNIAEDMTREGSNQSTNSMSSGRSTERLKQQLALGSRPIAPKQSDDMTTMSLISRKSASNNMVRLVGADEIDDKGVAQIEKSNKRYTRPYHPKVTCAKCDTYPDFRGEHELRRHTDREHNTSRKAWIAVQCPDDGGPVPKVPLASCKSCRTHKKYYAYYNAAAHLRRAHFHPRKKRKGKGKVALAEEEARGGKGGGDSPPMDVLKKWMREVEELVVDSVHNDSNEATAETTTANVDNSSSGMEAEGFDTYSLSHATSTSLNGYSGSANIATTAPFVAGHDFQAAADNGYYEPERIPYQYNSYINDCQDVLLDSNSTNILTDLHQVNSNEHSPLNAISTFNDEFISRYCVDVDNNPFPNGF